MPLAPPHVARARTSIVDVAEGVFAAVDMLREAVVRCHRDGVVSGKGLRARDVRGIDSTIHDLLREHAGIVTGLGLIMEPGVLEDEPQLLQWWQAETAGSSPVALDVDLDPTSLGFYDYAAAPWFEVPRRSRGRHVVGPYVDVHGTGRYLMTFTIPVEVGGRFLGVVGADVPVSEFETTLMARLDPSRAFVVVNAERRVVMSTSARCPVGARVDAVASGREAMAAYDLPDLSWQLLAGFD